MTDSLLSQALTASRTVSRPNGWTSDEVLYEAIANSSGGDWASPVPHDKKEFTYVNTGAADDDLVSTIVFKKAGATVSTLTFAYVGSTNNVQSITKS